MKCLFSKFMIDPYIYFLIISNMNAVMRTFTVTNIYNEIDGIHSYLFIRSVRQTY